MSLKSATVIVNNPTVSNPTTAAIEQPASSSSQPSLAAEKPKAAPVETTASNPSNPSNHSNPSEPHPYVWDPVAARDRINAAAEAGTITLTLNADGTAYEVSGDTKKVRAYLKGLNARWNSETTNWTLPALALTDPTAASAQRDAIVAERQAKRAERAAAAPAKPATTKAEPKKAEPKKSASKPAASKPTGAKTTYTAEEVQQLITKAVCAAFSMMGNMANNEKAIAALTEKLLSA